MNIHDKTCEFCNRETTQKLFSDYYEQWVAVCHDWLCERQFYRETQATINPEQL